MIDGVFDGNYGESKSMVKNDKFYVLKKLNHTCDLINHLKKFTVLKIRLTMKPKFI